MVELGGGGKVTVSTRWKRIRSGVRPKLEEASRATGRWRPACRRRRTGRPGRGRRQVGDAASGDRHGEPAVSGRRNRGNSEPFEPAKGIARQSASSDGRLHCFENKGNTGRSSSEGSLPPTGQRTPTGTRGSPRHRRGKPAMVELGGGGKVSGSTRWKRVRSGVRPKLEEASRVTGEWRTACRRRRTGRPGRGRRQVGDAASGDRHGEPAVSGRRNRGDSELFEPAKGIARQSASSDGRLHCFEMKGNTGRSSSEGSLPPRSRPG